MRDFLVEITTAVPSDVPAEEVDRRRAAEHERAGELSAAGRLYRLWRPVGEKRSVGIWRADDEDRLRTEVLSTLPMWPWMTAVITPLEPHPNDPGPAS